MLVTEFGMAMLVRLLQFWNAQAPILVTELGMVTLLRPVQLLYLQSIVYQANAHIKVEK